MTKADKAVRILKEAKGPVRKAEISQAGYGTRNLSIMSDDTNKGITVSVYKDAGVYAFFVYNGEPEALSGLTKNRGSGDIAASPSAGIRKVQKAAKIAVGMIKDGETDLKAIRDAGVDAIR